MIYKLQNGGNLENEPVPNSTDEYIKNKLESMRESALEKSRTRTEPVTPMIPVTQKTIDERTALYKDERDLALSKAQKSFAPWATLRMRLRDRFTNRINPLAFKTDSDEKNYYFWTNFADMMSTGINNLPGLLGTIEPGLSCLYTATDNYGVPYRVSGNQTFFANPGRYGFTRIPFSEAMPGDIVQDVSKGTPMHAMMLDHQSSGVNYYNYSQGGKEQEDYVKSGTYYPTLENNNTRNAYRFVGTPTDSLRWKQEYENGQFKQGGVIKGQNGFLNMWQKAYNSKFGKGVRDFMFGKDRDLSDEEYFNKYGYNKPIGGIGVVGLLVAPEWEGLEALPVAENFGKVGIVNGIPKTAQLKPTVIKNFKDVPKLQQPKSLSKLEKFLQKSKDDQNNIVRFWNGEKFNGIDALRRDEKAFKQFEKWINKQ